MKALQASALQLVIEPHPLDVNGVEMTVSGQKFWAFFQREGLADAWQEVTFSMASLCCNVTGQLYTGRPRGREKYFSKCKHCETMAPLTQHVRVAMWAEALEAGEEFYSQALLAADLADPLTSLLAGQVMAGEAVAALHLVLNGQKPLTGKTVAL